MLKYAGICLLSVCMAIYGVIKSADIKKALVLRKSVTQLLHHIENSVTYTGKSKDDIFNNFSTTDTSLSAFLRELCNTDETEKCINRHLDILSKKDKQMLTAFFNGLGKSTRREKEAKYCLLFTEEFERQGIDAEKEQLNKIMLYRKLGIIFALITAVIFL